MFEYWWSFEEIRANAEKSRDYEEEYPKAVL